MKFNQSLRKTSIFFKEEKNFNIINILFPQVWQSVPKKTNPAFSEIKEKNLEREVQILKYAVRFVQDTRRFNTFDWNLTIINIIIFMKQINCFISCIKVKWFKY